MRKPPRRGQLTDVELEVLRRRGRVLVLLDAAERAGVSPLQTQRFHAFAYLADVLSPVWDFPAFSGTILKTTGGPFYRDLQREVDRLVVMGLVAITELTYVERPRSGARISGKYALNFSSEFIEPILSCLGARGFNKALDERDVRFHAYLVELATALARLPDDEIDKAASADVTYSDPRVSSNNLLELNDSKQLGWANLSVATAQRFSSFLPDGISLSPGQRVFLYASYLGKRIHAA